MVADRTVKVTLDANISPYQRALMQARTSTSAFAKSLDTSNDRMSALVQTGLALGPALVPISAAAIPAISGLSNQLAFAGIGAGVAVLAFQGVGDSLKALNEYQLEPTEANLEKLNEAMNALGPAGREFVHVLQGMRPEMQRLQDIAQEGLFPGVSAGLTDLLTLMPRFERIVDEVASAMGLLAAEAGETLAGPEWEQFFTFLEREAQPTLVTMGRTIGNFARGFAELWMAFDPISDQFSASFLRLSRDFAEWADGLDQTQGFQDFIDYLARITPKVWDTLGSVAEALVAVVTAAAPVGEVALPVIEVLAEALTKIVSSPAGPALIGIAAGLSAISRATALYNVAQGAAITDLLRGSRPVTAVKDLRAASSAYLDFGAALDRTGPRLDAFRSSGERLRSTLPKVGLGVAGLGVAMTGLDDKIGLSNTAMFALMGTMLGPWGAAAGGAIGFAMDFAASNNEVADASDRAKAALSSSATSYEQQAEAVRQANEVFAAYKKDVEDIGLIDFDAFANGIKGLFGTSEIEAGEAAMRARNEALDQARQKTLDQTFAEAGLADEMAGASQASRDQTAALLENVEAMNAKRDAALAATNGEIAFEQAIDDASASAKENKATLDLNTQAGRDNMTSLTRLAASWNELTPAQQNAKGASERAREEFIRIARQMGATKSEAKALADQYLKIPSKVTTTVKADTVSALNALQGVVRYMNGMNGKIVRVAVQGQLGGGITRADGGEIRGPGGPRDDIIPVLASNGEYVINARSYAKHKRLVQAINADKYADGGEIGKAQPMPPIQYIGNGSGPGTPQGTTLTQHIYPTPGMSERSVGDQAANRVMFAMAR